ncbi:unnamed protein product, partial [Amoebophrya sp. A25]
WLREITTVSPLGLYKVRLFMRGQWRDTFVDDRMPEAAPGDAEDYRGDGEPCRCFENV